MVNQEQEIAQSPCIRHCCLDQNDRCVGCFRTLDEIAAWRSFNQQQKLAVLHECDKRKKLADAGF
ncbi:DUF1289 domain-containing protein [Vibrio sp. 99-8-1]|uniref:DUF1289 domain-containing protein n=1 Tax=Vibrio sp. 99-8-1 TaxID=2607602 RepID=UPI0014937190|nr:DUF1289 domain-containing protein [Vibrio sp. 99-8-1]NOI68079.1 DUF1289 domain-containing protein [Vibrio sp. 99-8-1]